MTEVIVLDEDRAYDILDLPEPEWFAPSGLRLGTFNPGGVPAFTTCSATTSMRLNVQAWCAEHLEREVAPYYDFTKESYALSFGTAADAVHFKLRWY